MVSRALVAVRESGGVADSRDVAASVGRSALAWGVRSGQVVRALPRTLMAPAEVGEWSARCAAALGWAGPGSAISHRSALRLWGLGLEKLGAPGTLVGAPGGDVQPVDVLVDHSRRLTPSGPGGSGGVVLHRSRHPPSTRTRQGLTVVTFERAIVESWPLMAFHERRAPTLVAVRERMTTPERLRREVARHPRLAGRRALLVLVDLVEQGCHSELELWGHLGVFTDPRFERLERQVVRHLLDRSVRYDLWDPLARVDIELDGRGHHADTASWERDIARDAAVAEIGDLTLRFSHARLTHDPAGCRERAWRVISTRRQQLDGT